MYRKRPQYKEQHSKYMTRRSSMNRLKVLELMGGKCVKCGISDYRLLEISHKNGDGYLERRGLNGKKMHGGWATAYAILRGWRQTDDLELLCSNCHILYEYEKGFRRTVFTPHKKYEHTKWFSNIQLTNLMPKCQYQ